MASLSAIRDALRDTLTDNISGVEVYDTVPDVVITPAFVIEPESADFDVAMARGTDTWTFNLYVLCGRAVADEGQDQLDAYVTGAGGSSVRAAIFADKTLGLADTNAHVSAMTAYGAKFESAQTPHIGAVLTVIVHTAGTA